MKKNIAMAVGMALLAMACTAKTNEYSAADGAVKATVKVGTDEWHITKADGTEVVPDYDSMRVMQTGDEGHPMTVVYYIGNRQHWLQYYSTMQLRSEGDMVGGQREGRWVYYHPNGNVQSECTFVAGQEDGPYRVYRENGRPYYLGQYTAGQRTGRWEVYDDMGVLVETKEY